MGDGRPPVPHRLPAYPSKGGWRCGLAAVSTSLRRLFYRFSHQTQLLAVRSSMSFNPLPCFLANGAPHALLKHLPVRVRVQHPRCLAVVADNLTHRL